MSSRSLKAFWLWPLVPEKSTPKRLAEKAVPTDAVAKGLSTNVSEEPTLVPSQSEVQIVFPNDSLGSGLGRVGERAGKKPNPDGVLELEQ